MVMLLLLLLLLLFYGMVYYFLVSVSTGPHAAVSAAQVPVQRAYPGPGPGPSVPPGCLLYPALLQGPAAHVSHPRQSNLI